MKNQMPLKPKNPEKLAANDIEREQMILEHLKQVERLGFLLPGNIQIFKEYDDRHKNG